MKKILPLMMFGILLLTSMVSADVHHWQNQIIEVNTTDGIFRDHIFVKFRDTSTTFWGRQKAIPLTLEVFVKALPYSLTHGSVDWCNLTVKINNNEYDENLQVINDSTETISLFYGTGSSNVTVIERDIRDQDSVIADIDCHYTDIQDFELPNAFVGSIKVDVPAYECEGCTQFTLEELSNEVERLENTFGEESTLYTTTDRILELNYTVWVIIFWLIKIFFVFIALWFVFSGIYYLYKNFQEIVQNV